MQLHMQLHTINSMLICRRDGSILDDGKLNFIADKVSDVYDVLVID